LTSSGWVQAMLCGPPSIGAWTFLVTVGVFSGETQRWVTFASAAAQVVNLHANELPVVRRVPETKAA
jgi:hypothetical protein